MRADARANRQRILSAATELFATEGLAVSLDEIARYAGVGPGTLHRHFPTKDGLIAAVALGRLEELVAAAQHRAGGTHPGAALRDQLSEMIVAGDGNAPLKQALAGAAEDVAWSQTDVSRRLRDALGVLLTEAQRARGARSDLDAEDLMSLLAGCYSAIQRAGVPADSTVGRRLTSVLLTGIGLPS
ncbi:MAG: TetR/AcrR family transcriptional regulator [Solirubrobacteraceae bacterium]